MISKRSFVGAGLLLAAVGAFYFTTRFRVLTPEFRHEPAVLLALESFPYEDWSTVLSTHVDDEGLVAYDRLRTEREPLDRFVALIRDVGPYSRPDLFRSEAQQLAFYLNAYNALVLFNVLDHWPLASPRDIRGRFFYTTRFVVDGHKTNLYELENHVIRRGFIEPRVHFALNCASLGCPALAREPFLPEQLEEQLASAASRFLHETRNVGLEGDEIVMSELFAWYEEDFPPNPVAWIRLQAPDLLLPDEAAVRFRTWDWSINAHRQ